MNLIDKDSTPKATPIPMSRPSPSVLIACSADAIHRAGDASRGLRELLSRIPDGATADVIRYALNDLAVMQKSLEAIQAEAAKGVR